MRLSLPLVMVLLLAGCVDVNDTPVNTRPAAITATDRGHIQAAITDDLKDPSAAQTRKLQAYDLSNGEGRVICGEMNGKNSFGAYVGFQPFYLRVKDGAVVSKYVGSGSPSDVDHMKATQGCQTAASGQMMIKSGMTAQAPQG